MPRLRSALSRPIQRIKRLTDWGLGPVSGASSVPLAVTGTGQQLGIGIALVLESAVTLVRIRGDFLFFLKTATAVGDGFSGALGIGLVTNEAFAVGATAVPGPVSEADWNGWVFHTFFNVLSPLGGSSGGATHQRITMDSKAMRKWSEGMTLVPVLEVVEHGTATADAFFDSRILVKLS